MLCRETIAVPYENPAEHILIYRYTELLEENPD
jgi:hypothetical protein